MKFNAKKYFEIAKERGLDPFILSYSNEVETSVEVFNGEVELQQIGQSQTISGKGIYQGKSGSFSTDCIDKETPELMIDNIISAANFGKDDKAENFFSKKERYKKAKIDSASFKKVGLKELREEALNLYEIIRAKDARIKQCTTSISMLEESSQLENSFGIKCKESMRLFVGFCEIVAEDEDGEPRSEAIGFRSFLSLDELHLEAIKKIDKLISGAVDFFKSKPAPSKKYKAVLSNSAVASLLSYFTAQLNAKSVINHLSLFENKIGEKITSSALTIKNTPHVQASSSSSYDSEGHPTIDFTLLDKGVLKTYFHSVETANHFNIESNGCATGGGNAGYVTLTVTPGKGDVDSLFKKMKDGIYITSLSGLNSGINSQTLDFSLPCSGYLIKDGKKAEAVSMIICAGNLQDIFLSVQALANDTEYNSGIFTPSILIEELAVSGQ